MAKLFLKEPFAAAFGKKQMHHQRHRAAFQSPDEVDLQETLMKKFIGFQSLPTFLKGRIRKAMQFALEAILQATTVDQTLRSWKLWFLLPRMLLHRPPGIPGRGMDSPPPPGRSRQPPESQHLNGPAPNLARDTRQ